MSSATSIIGKHLNGYVDNSNVDPIPVAGLRQLFDGIVKADPQQAANLRFRDFMRPLAENANHKQLAVLTKEYVGALDDLITKGTYDPQDIDTALTNSEHKDTLKPYLIGMAQALEDNHARLAQLQQPLKKIKEDIEKYEQQNKIPGQPECKALVKQDLDPHINVFNQESKDNAWIDSPEWLQNLNQSKGKYKHTFRLGDKSSTTFKYETSKDGKSKVIKGNVFKLIRAISESKNGEDRKIKKITTKSHHRSVKVFKDAIANGVKIGELAVKNPDFNKFKIFKWQKEGTELFFRGSEKQFKDAQEICRIGQSIPAGKNYHANLLVKLAEKGSGKDSLLHTMINDFMSDKSKAEKTLNNAVKNIAEDSSKSKNQREMEIKRIEDSIENNEIKNAITKPPQPWDDYKPKQDPNKTLVSRYPIDYVKVTDGKNPEKTVPVWPQKGVDFGSPQGSPVINGKTVTDFSQYTRHAGGAIQVDDVNKVKQLYAKQDGSIDPGQHSMADVMSWMNSGGGSNSTPQP